MPAGPDGAPQQALATAAGSVAAEYFSIANVTGGVSAGLDSNTGDLKVSLAQGSDSPEADFSLELRYASPTGSQVVPVAGRVRSAAVVAVASGNGQNGSAGEALRAPLVVRVTSVVDGSPIAGARVEWTVTKGDGSITTPSTTDADGYASATWTLGEDAEDEDQKAEARAFHEDAPTNGGPMAFTATASDEGFLGTWQLVEFDGESLPTEDHIAGSVTLDGDNSIVFRFKERDYEWATTYTLFLMTGDFQIQGDTISVKVVDEEGRTYTGPARIEGGKLVFEFKVESAYDPTNYFQLKYER